MITLSLGFTVTRVLFRFLIDRILVSVLSDRVFFESTEIGSSSLGYAVIDSSLHQSCSFSAMSLVFIKSCYYFFFFIKNRCFVLHSLKFSKIISLTCFNNFSKTVTEKMKKYIIETQCYIENICHQFPDLYNHILVNFKYRSCHRWCSSNKFS